MDQLTITAAAGMRSRTAALDLLANNIANAGAAGYKADREFYNTYISAGATAQSALPNVERNWIDFSQGILKETGNPLDIALSGRGFLTVEGPGGALYTRNGSLRLSAAGVLQTAEGYAVKANTPNGRIHANPQGGPLVIQKDGTVSQDGQPLGGLSLADAASPQSAQKQGGVYFRLADTKALTAGEAEVLQGRLEESNAGPAEAAVRLVGVLRQFEMLQKAMHLGSEMGRKAVEEVARV
jgi:flagellar basal-body rod protein FlgF